MDLRRTCARLYLAGEELERIQFLLGHAVQTTERYLGCKQSSQAVNDKVGLEDTKWGLEMVLQSGHSSFLI